MTLHRTLPAVLCAAALLATITACSPVAPAVTHSPTHSPTPSATADAGPAIPAGLTPSQIAALPAATYSAVIPGLLPAQATADIRTAYHVVFDSVAYGADFTTPVARIPAKNFLGEPTVVVRVQTKGRWSLVLTPSRQQLPSAATAAAPAPAQSAAWIPTSFLHSGTPLTTRIVISTSKQTLSILDSSGAATKEFTVGVGTASTPTPTGTGYLQARYLDPAQGQSEHRIQLTSLHATSADEPYGGADGGLIGIHFQSTAAGAVSHGCVRLAEDAIAAVDALPLGTPVQIVD